MHGKSIQVKNKCYIFVLKFYLILMKTIESKIKRVPLINNVQLTIVVQMKRFISNVDEFIVKFTITS